LDEPIRCKGCFWTDRAASGADEHTRADEFAPEAEKMLGMIELFLELMGAS